MSYVVLCEECIHDIGSHGHDGCTEHFGGGCSQTATDIARTYGDRRVREALEAEPSDAEVEAVAKVMRDEGVDHADGGWHSWRCFDMESKARCNCTDEMARDVLRAAAKVRAEQ